MLFDGFGSHYSRFKPQIRIVAVQKYLKHPVCFIFIQPLLMTYHTKGVYL